MTPHSARAGWATRRSVLLGGGAALSTVVASRGRTQEAMLPAGGVLRVAFSSDPAGFDPARGPSGMSHIVIEQVYSTLMALDADANPYPDLADSYEVSADGLVYTFRLRSNVRFHNGDPLTAEDVKFTFDRLRDPQSGYAYLAQVASIADVTAVDPLTVRFVLTAETGPFLTAMAFPGSSIVPKALVDAGHDLNAAPIGSGPFRFVSYQPRSRIVLERNPDFYEAGRPVLTGLEFEIIADTTSLTAALLSGTVDLSNEVPPRDWRRIQSTPGIVTNSLEGSRYYWLVPNNTRPPFDDPLVRQAIGHAIDRSAIVAATFFGQATPILGGVIPGWSWAHADVDAFAPEANPARASELLAEAGLSGGFRMTFSVASSFPALVSIAPIVQANLAAVGIDVVIETMEVPRFWDEVWGPSNFDMTSMFWISPLADPDDFVFNNYACDTPINVQQSCSPEMDAILRAARQATDRELRRRAYADQQRLSVEQLPIVPLVNAHVLSAWTDRLRGFVPMRMGFLHSLRDAGLG